MSTGTGTGFLQESPGVRSSMRQAMFMSYFMAFGLSCYVLYVKWEAGIILPLSFLGISTGGKVWQKFAEKKP